MKKVIDKTVNLDLIGHNGNAFAIMGVFRIQARKEGWTPEEIKMVLDEAKSSDYDHLLATIINHCESKDEVKTNAMETTHYEIYWHDLTEDAQVRLKGLYHDNIELCPLAIIDIENEEE